MSRIIIFKGPFQYGAVNAFSDGMARGFVEEGFENVFLETPDAEIAATEISKGCEFVMAFNAVGGNLALASGNIFERAAVPFVAPLVDHPAHQVPRIDLAPPGIFLTCHARSHLNFLKAYYGKQSKAAFLPHGGTEAKDCENIEAAGRSMNIMFPGTREGIKKHTDFIDRLSPASRDFVYGVRDAMMACDSMAVEEAFFRAGSEAGLDLREDRETFRNLRQIISTVEFLVRAMKRDRLLKILDENGISVDIFGNGWEENEFKVHRIHPPLGFYEILKKMRNCKIVINALMAPGSHERVFTSMLNGALCLSDWNEYLEGTFTDGENIVFYRWTQIEKASEIISSILADPVKLNRIAGAGKAECEKKHKWEDRAKELLKIYESFRTK